MIFIMGSHNHYSVFSRIKPHISFNFDIWNKFGHNEKLDEYASLPVPSILNQIKIVLFLLKQEIRNYHLKKANVNRVLIFKTYNNFLGAVDLFKLSKIKSIILFNDHVAWYRAFIFAAKRTSVKSIYIPHASVSDRFPKLEFDYAFMEGDDMRKKYLEIGPTNTKMLMVGNCKFDKYRKEESPNQIRAKDETITRIGIAFNLMQEALEVQKLQMYLSSKLSVKIEFIIRPHPAIVDKTAHYYSTLSDPRKEDSLSYIKNLDVLLATNSNIILESLLMNCPVIHIDVTGNTDADNYGFVSKGIVNPAISNSEDIYRAILSFIVQEKGISTLQKEKLKTYDYSLGTEFEGKVGQVIAEELERIALN